MIGAIRPLGPLCVEGLQFATLAGCAPVGMVAIGAPTALAITGRQREDGGFAQQETISAELRDRRAGVRASADGHRAVGKLRLEQVGTPQGSIGLPLPPSGPHQNQSHRCQYHQANY